MRCVPLPVAGVRCWGVAGFLLPARVSAYAFERAEEVGKAAPEIREQRCARPLPVHARAIQIERHAGRLEEGSPRSGPTPREVDGAPARKELSALAPDEMAGGNEHPVFDGGGLAHQVPEVEVSRAAALRAEVPRRRGGDNYQDLRSVEGEEGRCGRVEHLLADQHPDAAKPGVEGAELLSRRDEARLVEDAVRREKDLPVAVDDAVRAPCGREPRNGVVDRSAILLVEPEDNVRAPGWGGAERGGHNLGGAGDLLHAALDEVSRERGLGKDDDVGPSGRVAHRLAHGPQVRLHPSLGGPELHELHAGTCSWSRHRRAPA